MPSYFDLTSGNFGLKELYKDPTKVQNLVYKNNPALALMEKDTSFSGEYMPIPVIIEAGQTSSTFSYAQANQSPTAGVKFLLSMKTDYSIATIKNILLLATRNNEGAFISAAETEIDSKIRACTNKVAEGLFGDGTGTIGRVNASGLSTGVFTLSSASDVTKFAKGQTLTAMDTIGGGTIRAGIGYVIALNRVSGQITVSATGQGGAAGTPSGWAANDYLVPQGDLNARILGFGAWLPTTEPTSGDNFLGVDRSSDPVRLAGLRQDYSDRPVEEALTDFTQLIHNEGGRCDTTFINSRSYSALVKSLGAKVQYVDVDSGIAGIGFRAIEIHGADGPVKVIPDRSCPARRAYCLQMDTWKLWSMEDAPHLQTWDINGSLLRIAGDDAAEGRVVSYANLACNAPGWNGVVTLGA